MNFYILVFLAIACFVKTSESLDLSKNLKTVRYMYLHPRYFIVAKVFKICPRNSTDLSACIKESVENIRPKLKICALADDLKI